jgi:hypothetical protein
MSVFKLVCTALCMLLLVSFGTELYPILDHIRLQTLNSSIEAREAST